MMPFIFILSNVLTQAPNINIKKPTLAHQSKQFQYSVKKYKVNSVEYLRVPTKWKKEAVAN